MSEHSRLSPSSMARILKCPGSAVDNPPDDGNAAADRGTRLHDITNRTLLGEMLGDHEYKDDEERKQVFACVAYVLAHTDQAGDDPMVTFFEQRIESKIIADHGGTIDVILVSDSLIHVIDFKFGVMPVRSQDNKQLLSYLCLVDEEFPSDRPRKYLGSIVQPAVSGTPECAEYTRDDLVGHICDVMLAEIDNSLQAGSHCRWCPLKRSCEVLEAANKAAAAEAFDDGWDATKCLQVMEMADVVKTLAEDAKKRLREILMEGTEVEGWRLARQLGNRCWQDEDAAVAVLLDKGLVEDIIFDRKIKSPAQLEKFSKAYKPVVASLTHRPEKGVIAVTNESKLPEYTPGCEFDEIIL